jgi:hypothetical protein
VVAIHRLLEVGFAHELAAVLLGEFDRPPHVPAARCLSNGGLRRVFPPFVP